MQPLVLGKYEVMGTLAAGGMGEVLLARQHAVAGFDRYVILKRLLATVAASPGQVTQFLDEARVSATLNHPNIVSVYDVDQWEGTYYIVMEYVRGVSVAQLLRLARQGQKWLPPQVVAKVGGDVAAALDFAYRSKSPDGTELRVIHRDISPQNIMVTGEGVTKVVDFGIAKATNKQSHTLTGSLKGKLNYMSPEQIAGVALDQRSDQFALGIVLWEMCTCTRRFKFESLQDAVLEITQNDSPPVSELRPGIPSDIEQVIVRMLQRDRNDRFADWAAVGAALSQHSDAPLGASVSSLAGEMIENAAETVDLANKETDATAVLVRGLSQFTPVRATKPKRRIVAMMALLGLGIAAGLAGVSFLLPPKQSDGPKEAPPAIAKPEPTGVRDPVKPPSPSPAAEPMEKNAKAPAASRKKSGRGRSRAKKKKVATVETPPPASPVSAVGFLSVNTTPWTSIFVDGEPYGTTPVFRITLASGKRKLRLVNAGEGIDERQVLNVKPNEETKLQIDLTNR